MPLSTRVWCGGGYGSSMAMSPMGCRGETAKQRQRQLAPSADPGRVLEPDPLGQPRGPRRQPPQHFRPWQSFLFCFSFSFPKNFFLYVQWPQSNRSHGIAQMPKMPEKAEDIQERRTQLRFLIIYFNKVTRPQEMLSYLCLLWGASGVCDNNNF